MKRIPLFFTLVMIICAITLAAGCSSMGRSGPVVTEPLPPAPAVQGKAESPAPAPVKTAPPEPAPPSPDAGDEYAPDHVFTLDECIGLALARHPSISSAGMDVDASRLGINQARANFLPKLGLTYGYTRLDEAPWSSPLPIPGVGVIPAYQVGDRDNYELVASISQPIFTGFANTARYRLAELGMDVSELSKEQADMDMVLGVKQAYFVLLGAQRAQNVADQSVRQLQTHLQNANALFEEGQVPQNQVLEAKVRVARAERARIEAENQVAIARANLNSLMLRPMGAPVKVRDIMSAAPMDRSMEECLSLAEHNRPELRAARKNLAVKDEQIRLAQSSYYPSVALSYNHIKEGDTPTVEGGTYHEGYSWNVMVTASWNVWEWGRTRDEVQISRIRRRQADAALKQLSDAVQLEVRQAYLNLGSAGRNIAVSQEALVQAEESYRMSEERYREGEADAAEVIDAETLLTEARSNLDQALFQYMISRAVLERAMGLRGS